MTKSWIQIDGKLIPKEEYHGNNVRGPSIHVMPDINPVKSPVDGSVINSRPQLREHNRKHGVTNSADYSPEFLQAKAKERHMKATGMDKQSRQEKREFIARTLENPRKPSKTYRMPGPGKPNPR
jgi:hypothetical protein